MVKNDTSLRQEPKYQTTWPTEDYKTPHNVKYSLLGGGGGGGRGYDR